MRLRWFCLLAACFVGLLLLWQLMGFAAPSEIEMGEQGAGVKHGAQDGALADARKSRAGEQAQRVAVNARPSGKKVTLRGTFVVTDSRGRVYPKQSGKFLLGCWTGKVRRGVEVEVLNGAWTALIEPCPKFSCGAAVLGGQPVLCDGSQRTMPSEGPLALKGRWRAGTTLRVIGADTRTDLAAVTVIHIREMFHGIPSQPGNMNAGPVIVDAVDSPLRIHHPGASSQSTNDYWVHAPGYVWDRIRIAHASGQAREIRLDRGGNLDVQIDTASLPKGLVFRLRRLDNKLAASDRPAQTPVVKRQEFLKELHAMQRKGPPDAEFKPELRGKTHLTGIAEGRYSIQLERGIWYWTANVLGSAEAEVRVGETSSVILELGPARKPTLAVPVTGSLHLPPAWKRDALNLRIKFDPVDKTRRNRAQFVGLELLAIFPDLEPYTWGTHLVPGTYDVSIDALGVRKRVKIGNEGNRNLRLIAEQPSTVIVKVIDRATRKPVVPRFLSWGFESSNEEEGFQPYSVSIDSKTGSGTFQAAPGSISFSVERETYTLSGNRNFEVQAGRNNFTLELERACGVTISLREGSVDIPWESKWRATLKEIGGKGRHRYWPDNRVAATRPGHYVLSFAKVKGYEAMPDRKVTIRQGSWTKVAIQLRRLR